jgi:hypothetical protein
MNIDELQELAQEQLVAAFGKEAHVHASARYDKDGIKLSLKHYSITGIYLGDWDDCAGTRAGIAILFNGEAYLHADRASIMDGIDLGIRALQQHIEERQQ